MEPSLTPDGFMQLSATGFGILMGSYAILLENDMAKSKQTTKYLQQAFFNSVRFSQFSSFLLLIVCCLLVAHKMFEAPIFFIAAIKLSCVSLTFIVISFTFHFSKAGINWIKEFNNAYKQFQQYRALNLPPNTK
jgi:hypothetical protein